MLLPFRIFNQYYPMAIGVDCPNESHYRIVDRICEACLDVPSLWVNFRGLQEITDFLCKWRSFLSRDVCSFLNIILYKRAALSPEKNGRTFWERHGWPVMVVSRHEFLRPLGNYRFLVQMVLFSLKKRVFFLEHILYKRATLIPEKRPYALRASWSTCTRKHVCYFPSFHALLWCLKKMW